MNEIEFRNWLINNDVSKKVAGDIVSRVKRIEREIGSCDTDEEYHRDRCTRLLSVFANNGINKDMRMHTEVQFPLGKYHMSTYRHALNKYIRFMDVITLSN